MSLNIAAPVTVFAGLAPVPLLYAAGVRLSTRQNLRVMDYNRFEQKWHMLDDCDDGERVVVNYPENFIGEDVAIAMTFTVSIAESQLPSSLTDKTIWIRLDGRGPRADAFSSEEKMKSALRTVHDLIRNLRSREGYEKIEKVHLFIAAQASTVVKLGSEYQSNIYPEIRIYHFQGAEGKYSWAISIRNGKFYILDKISL
ncbi:MAG: SAVED domain-containing protein [Deltaproteobacteria bacterium]|nr:SAVED domain-containing protein [Deltaproteobacteria bacterium]